MHHLEGPHLRSVDHLGGQTAYVLRHMLESSTQPD